MCNHIDIFSGSIWFLVVVGVDGVNIKMVLETSELTAIYNGESYNFQDSRCLARVMQIELMGKKL